MTSLAYVFIVVSLCVLGAAYQTQTGWLYILGACGLGIVPLAWAMARWELAGARVRALPVAPADQGGNVTFELSVERIRPGKAFGLQLLLPDRPLGPLFRLLRLHLIPASWRSAAVGELGRGERRTVVFTLRTARRGAFPLPAFRLQSAFPLGLVALTRPVTLPGEFLVFPVGPRLTDVPWLSPKSEDAGQKMRFEAGHGSAPRGVREYRPGDAWRQIHWRTTARLGTPHVKETEREQGESVVIYLDMRPEVHTPATVEHAVAIATSLLHHVRAQGRNVTLATQPEAAPPEEDRPGEATQLAWLARVNPAAGAGAPQGRPGAILVSPAYVPGWQHWADHCVYCPGSAANPMDATAYCPVGLDIADALSREARP